MGAAIAIAIASAPATATPARSRDEFDYSCLDNETADRVRRYAESIKYRETCVGKEIAGIGADLIEVKARLGHGQFGKWLTSEFDWDERTARRFMSVAEAFKGKSDTVADLLPTTLYALAAPSTPVAVRETVVQLREAGTRVADHVVKSMIAEARRKEGRSNQRKAAAEARAARQSPEALRRAERERRNSEAILRKSAAALAQIVEILRDRVGNELPDFIKLLDAAGPGGLWRLQAELQKLVTGESEVAP